MCVYVCVSVCEFLSLSLTQALSRPRMNASTSQKTRAKNQWRTSARRQLADALIGIFGDVDGAAGVERHPQRSSEGSICSSAIEKFVRTTTRKRRNHCSIAPNRQVCTTTKNIEIQKHSRTNAMRTQTLLRHHTFRRTMWCAYPHPEKPCECADLRYQPRTDCPKHQEPEPRGL
jgi:hypothetical protein